MKPDSTPQSRAGETKPAKTPMLAVDGLAKSYPNKKGAVRAIEQVSFTLHEGEFVSIVGPSGCGKTTLLSCIAGLLPPTAGEVELGGSPVTGPPEGLSVVFQDYSRSLFPWLSVESNVGLPLKSERRPKAEIKRDVATMLKQVGLDPSVASRYPWQLSGGMQQRASIARALAFDADLLLMDEPFGALDEIVRDHLNAQLLQLWARTGKTICFVTHSIPEAVYLSTRIVVMSPRPGRVTDVIESTLPKERPLDIRETPEFLEIAHRVREGLRAGRSYED